MARVFGELFSVGRQQVICPKGRRSDVDTMRDGAGGRYLGPSGKPPPQTAHGFLGAGSGPPPCGNVKRNEPKTM